MSRRPVECFKCRVPLSWQGARCKRCDWKTTTCIVTAESLLECLSDAELNKRAATKTLAQQVYRRRMTARAGLDT